MSIPLKEYLTGLRFKKKKRRQFACVVTALSVFVSGGVFWQLRGIGTAFSDKAPPYYDDSGGTVSLSNSAEFETADIWEATLPPLTDSAGENLALVAESQLGYSEYTIDYIHAEDGESHSGYSRYGAWYGNPYGEWNTMFTYFCMNYAGIRHEDIPYGSGCWAWSLELDQADLIIPVTRGSPARGDILLIDSDLDGKADRSCIVCSTVTDGDAPGIYTVEGDVGGTVAETFYSWDCEGFIGAVSLADIVPEPPVMNEAPELPTVIGYTAESESGIRVEAFADIGAFPEDTEMSVFDVSHDEAVEAAAQLSEDTENIDAVAVDITFTAPDGTELEPAEGTSVRVSISLPQEQALPGGEYSLLHVQDSGEVEIIENASVNGDGAVFETESFSVYMILGWQTISSNSLIMANGQIGGNTAASPLELYVGENIELFMDTYFHMLSGIDVLSATDGGSRTSRTINVEGTEYSGWVGTFSAQQPGLCSLGDDNNVNVFYIKVVPALTNPNTIMVKREYDEKDKDHIKEYLPGYSLLQTDPPGYVKNTVGEPNTHGKSYTLRIGDEIRVRSTLNNGSFSLNNSILTFVRNEVINGNTYSVYRADNSGSTKIQHIASDGTTVTDQIFINVLNTNLTAWNEVFAHCDMEIADDGFYTITEVDSTGVKTVTIYKAVVSNINNDTKVFKSDGSILATIPTEAYKKLGNPGESQYEFTSAYYSGNFPYLGDQSVLHDGDVAYYEDPENLKNPHFWAQDYPRQSCSFDPNLVDHVVFDVGLTLIPYERYTVTNNVESTHQSLSGEENVTISSMTFELSGQSIIDAMNKCPLCNGFDFTVQIKNALVQLQAEKILSNNGIQLKEGQFEFELLRDQTEFKALKVGRVNEAQQIPDTTFSPSTVFPGMNSSTDTVRTYQLIQHDNGVTYSSDLLADHNTVNTAYDLYTTGNLIDGFVIGGTPTESERNFYSGFSKYISPAKAIYLNNSGNFELGNGHYLFAKNSITEAEQVATAQNNADGKITFDFQELKSPGFYHFFIHEVNTNDPDVEYYDNSYYGVTVKVNEDMSVDVIYDGIGLTPPTFTNTLREYTLPATGGSGTLPYYTFGAALIAASALLFVKKRREGR